MEDQSEYLQSQVDYSRPSLCTVENIIKFNIQRLIHFNTDVLIVPFFPLFKEKSSTARKGYILFVSYPLFS